jgi:hypothetical protein
MPPTRASLAAPGAGALPSTIFSTSSVQPRWTMEISDNGLTRRKWTRSCPLARPSRAFTFGRIPFAVSQTAQVSRTSAGEVITTLSPCDNVAQASRLPSDEFDGRAGETPALLCGGDRIVVTTAMRASAGTRFNAMLQPTHPALRAVGGRAAPQPGRV